MFKLTVTVAALIGMALSGLKLYPGVVLLVQPGVKYRNPDLCSTQRAMAGVKTKLAQQKTVDRLTSEIRLVGTDHELNHWQTPDGSYWIRSGPKELLPTLLAQQQRNIYGDQVWGVHAGDVVLDCGAHVGVFTRKALAAGAKLVVAIEPAPAAVECLRRNFAEEIRSGKVVVYPKGVWDKDEVLSFFTDNNADAGDSFVMHEHTAGVEKIPVTTIDKLTQELGIPRVDFIKMDVKGSTERALRGGEKVIIRDRPRMALSTEEKADDPNAITKTVKAMVPAYQTLCGPCLLDQREVYLDVLMFRL